MPRTVTLSMSPRSLVALALVRKRIRNAALLAAAAGSVKVGVVQAVVFTVEATVQVLPLNHSRYRNSPASVSYTHLTLPTNREV